MESILERFSDNLTEVEMIELVMISENPFFYNKQKRLEIV